MHRFQEPQLLSHDICNKSKDLCVVHAVEDWRRETEGQDGARLFKGFEYNQTRLVTLLRQTCVEEGGEQIIIRRNL